MAFNIKECGLRIQSLRKQQGLTQEQLSTLLGIGERYLRKIEHGDASGSLDLLIEIAAYFGVTLDYLLLGNTVLSTKELKRQIHHLIISLTDFEQMM